MTLATDFSMDQLSTLGGRLRRPLSTDERRVSPMQIAALLIEDATQGLARQLSEN